MDRLRDLLVKARLATEAQVREAEKMGLAHQATLAHVLVRGGVIDTQKLAIFLSKKLGIEYAALAEREISPNVLEQLPLAVAQRLRAIPIALRKTSAGEEIVVAMSDPTDASARREIEHVVKKRVMALVADEVGLQRAINRSYGRAPEAVAPPVAQPPEAAWGPGGFVPAANPAAHFQGQTKTPPAFATPSARPPTTGFAPQASPPQASSPQRPGNAAPSTAAPPWANAVRPAEPPQVPTSRSVGRPPALEVQPHMGHEVEFDEIDHIPSLELASRPAGDYVWDEVAEAEDQTHGVNPQDFLSESTQDVAHMYAQAQGLPPPPNFGPHASQGVPPAVRSSSPLDAITMAPQPPVGLDSDPVAPHLQSSGPRFGGHPSEDPESFLTPNTEDHLALMGHGPAAFDADISLDEDTAWLRQRLRGEAAAADAEAADADVQPPPRTPPPTASTPAPPRRQSERKNAAPPPKPPPPRSSAARPSTTPGDFLRDESFPSTTTPSPPRELPTPTTSQDRVDDKSIPSATTPSPPRAMSAPTTREVGVPKSPVRPRRKESPPAPEFDLSSGAPLEDDVAERPTAAHVLDEETRIDFEGKIGAGRAAVLPSLPSDDDFAAAFDERTVPVESLPRHETDVLARPPRAQTLPSDSVAVMYSALQPVLEEGQTEISIAALPKGALPPPLRKRGGRRTTGDERPTRIVDFDRPDRGHKGDDEATAVGASYPERRPSIEIAPDDDAMPPTILPHPRDVEKTQLSSDVVSSVASEPVDDTPTRVVDAREITPRPKKNVQNPIDDAETKVVDVSAVPPRGDDARDAGDSAAEKTPPSFPSPKDDSHKNPPSADFASDDSTAIGPALPREERTHAAIQTFDDPPTQLDQSMAQMTMCIVCPTPRLRVDLGRAIRRSVSTLFLEETVSTARRLAGRVDVDIVVLIDPVSDPGLSDQLDRLSHRIANRPLVIVLAAKEVPLRIRRAHLRLERVADDDGLPKQISDAIAQMVDQ